MTTQTVYDQALKAASPDFGDYVWIEQKRFGVPNEMYQYKVVGRLQSNTWIDVPAQPHLGATRHDQMEEVLNVICCGVGEDTVERYRVADVRDHGALATVSEEQPVAYELIHPEGHCHGVYSGTLQWAAGMRENGFTLHPLVYGDYASPAPDVRPSVPAQDSEGTSEFDKGWLAGLAAATGPEMGSPSVPVSDEPNTVASLEAASGSMTDFAEAADLVGKIAAAETNGGALGIILKYRQKVRMEALASQPAAPVQQEPDNDVGTDYECSACGKLNYRPNGCGNCGLEYEDAAPAVQPAQRYLCTPKNGGQPFEIDRAPDSWDLRECDIVAVQAAPSVPDQAFLSALSNKAKEALDHALKYFKDSNLHNFDTDKICENFLAIKLALTDLQMLSAAPSAPSVSAPVEMETGWLVENGKQGDELRYRTMESGLPEWTADPNKAIRFARRIDAEGFAQEDEDAWAIVQHAWHDLVAAPAPSVSGDAGGHKPFGYFHELLNHEGKGTGIWLGCAKQSVVEQSHIEGETSKEIVPLYVSTTAAVSADAADQMDIDREGARFWHRNCANHLGGVMKVVKDEPTQSLIQCLHCGKSGYYPVGGVGRIRAAIAAQSKEPKGAGE